MEPRIGIIGSGAVGRMLGHGFVTLGHEVMLGSRTPTSAPLLEWMAANGPLARTGSPEEAARFAEIAVFAVRWSGAENAALLAGPGNLAGKIVIDTSNPLTDGPFEGTGLSVACDDSAGEQVQRWFPEASVVKAFNIVGNQGMFRPELPGGPPDMFICGNDEQAKHEVAHILDAFGFPDAIDIGGIECSRLLEWLTLLWIVCGRRSGAWDHAFKLLGKKTSAK